MRLILCFDFGFCPREMLGWCHSGAVTLSQHTGCVASRTRAACSGGSGSCFAVACFGLFEQWIISEGLQSFSCSNPC